MISLVNDDQISAAKTACTRELTLTFNGLTLSVCADNPTVVEGLKDYYEGLTLTGPGENQVEQRLILLDQQADISGIEWTPVKAAKKSSLGLKEAYADKPRGRWIHKVRTGMILFQSLTDPMAIGDLSKHSSQVINFINNQFLNHQQRCGYLLGHASAFDIRGNTTAIAASSGGGKSTLMLKALETEQVCFLSNDRVLFQPDKGQVRILGVPKHPRVNPGTLIHSKRLSALLPAAEHARFARMPQAELWPVEQKYDVLIPGAYGEGKTTLCGKLKNLILLDWSLASTAPTALSCVDITKTPEALEGLRKSRGPFYQDAYGRFPMDHTRPAEFYAQYLDGVQVLRLTGVIDFDRAIELLQGRGIL